MRFQKNTKRALALSSALVFGIGGILTSSVPASAYLTYKPKCEGDQVAAFELIKGSVTLMHASAGKVEDFMTCVKHHIQWIADISHIDVPEDQRRFTLEANDGIPDDLCERLERNLAAIKQQLIETEDPVVKCDAVSGEVTEVISGATIADKQGSTHGSVVDMAGPFDPSENPMDPNSQWAQTRVSHDPTEVDTLDDMAALAQGLVDRLEQTGELAILTSKGFTKEAIVANVRTALEAYDPAGYKVNRFMDASVSIVLGEGRTLKTEVCNVIPEKYMTFTF